MSRYIIVAETGADLPPDIVQRYKIKIVPMHVSFGSETRDDMSFPVEEVFEYYNKTGTLPKTSGSTPIDFEIVFDEIHNEFPNKHILYLAYSAVTTCSYQSALMAAQGRDYITSIDTKSCSAGQALVVLKMAEYLEKNPLASIQDIKETADGLIKNIRMGFLPGDLVYLKAGGRVSNAAYLGAKILSLNPLIEINDGRLVSTKKYRGSMLIIAPKLIKDYSEKHSLSRDLLAFIYSGTLDERLKGKAEQTALSCGFKNYMWIRTGCVVSTHSGPGAFGVAGFSR